MDHLAIVQSGLEMLLRNIKTYLENTFQSLYGNDFWVYMEHGTRALSEININQMKDYALNSDVSQFQQKKYRDVLFYINSIIKNWDSIKNLFSTNYILCLCHDIKHFRNKWAHQSFFNTREVYRFLDQAQALLEEMKLDNSEIDLLRKAIMEVFYTEEVNKAYGVYNTGETLVSQPQQKKENQNFNEYNNYNNGNLIKSNQNNFCTTISYNLGNEDHLMIDGDEIDKDVLHYSNYQKIITNQNQSENEAYTVTYFEENEDEKNIGDKK